MQLEAAQTRLSADKRWVWHPEYLLWGLLQANGNAASRALRSIKVDTAVLIKEMEKILKAETKPRPKSANHDQFGKEFATYLFAIKKHYGYGKQNDISSFDLLEGFTRFSPPRIVALLQEFGVTFETLTLARKKMKSAAFEAQGLTDKQKRDITAFIEQLIRDNEDAKEFGFESWEQAQQWLKSL